MWNSKKASCQIVRSRLRPARPLNDGLRASSTRRYQSSTSTSGANTSYIGVTHPDHPASFPDDVHAKLERFSKYTLNTYARPSFILTHGKGSWVYAPVVSSSPATSSSPSAFEGVGAPPRDTRAYLDFTAGIAVNALGHSDPEFARVLHEQANTLIHASNIYHNEWAGELAQMLVELTRRDGGLGFEPNSSESTDDVRGGAKVFFANSGTEANEGALKFARKTGKEKSGGDKKTELVCFTNAFHGRSMGALSVTPNEKYQAPFAPLIPDVKVGNHNEYGPGVLEELITENTCGVIVEPVQGEGGVRSSDEGFLRALRKRCDEVDAVLIFDEIQCGLYRTGKLWAHSAYPTDCHPDIVTMAKPLANGYPIGAILVRDHVAKAITVGSHGTTFGGSVMATRLGAHVLSRLSDPTFLAGLSAISTHLDTRLSHLPTYFPTLLPANERSVRGRGLLRGIPFADQTHPGKLVQMARERGVLLLTAGSDAVRLVPSLTVSREEVDLACDVIESCMHMLASTSPPSS